MSLYLLSFSGKLSLNNTGSARNSTSIKGIFPYMAANLLIQCDLSTMCVRSAESISVLMHSGHLNFFLGVT